MQTIKEKVSNAASSCKAHVEIYKSKAQKKAEKAAARTEEEKEIAYQSRKAKEAKAKMELHQAKAEHAAEKLPAKQSHSHLCYPNLTAGTGTGTHFEPPVVATQGHHGWNCGGSYDWKNSCSCSNKSTWRKPYSSEP